MRLVAGIIEPEADGLVLSERVAGSAQLILRRFARSNNVVCILARSLQLYINAFSIYT
jgi:hypothetical protein